MEEAILALSVILALPCAIIGAVILNYDNKAGTGFIVGGLFGVFGLLFCFVIRNSCARAEREKQHIELKKCLEWIYNKQN